MVVDTDANPSTTTQTIYFRNWQASTTTASQWVTNGWLFEYADHKKFLTLLEKKMKTIQILSLTKSATSLHVSGVSVSEFQATTWLGDGSKVAAPMAAIIL